MARIDPAVDVIEKNDSKGDKADENIKMYIEIQTANFLYRAQFLPKVCKQPVSKFPAAPV